MHQPAAPTRAFLVNKGLTAGDQVRVNIRTLANSAAIKREKRNGRDVIIVPSATLPDDVVMNDILYPAAEIAKSFKTLERTPAPLGHPSVNGKFLSARDPEGLNQGWIGAWNENVRQEGGRVLLDKVIDVERANQSEGGQRVLAAIDAGDPVHTSTGLLAIMDAANGDVPYKFTARDIEFDHDAILLDEDGAATPDQGVGMMVNSAGKEIQVVNSVFSDEAERELGWAVESAVRALEKKQRASLMDRIMTALTEAFGSGRETSTTNMKDDEMDKVQFDGLSAKVDALTEALKPETLATAIGNAVATAMKPINDQLEAQANSAKATEEAELKTLREKIVAGNIMDEAAAGELTLNAARALAPKAEPGKAAPIAPGFKLPGANAAKPAFKAPAATKMEA
ncbi:hypothetical protein PFY01_09150 [Brevundimonas vesicularis]|uniref:hypothetical protein n=1 Tax=Brevundimonas vesicularis TaxID=41276 RepID=UPI0022EC2A16|nr:hypothetical protein [Brevundimonas vesicularis]WBT04825.1 hypothetical protein PFY01_08720 [Brevundimonas vesicularis]WBT04909.1 hypothetical protein PFY01_09150 [Brevundimonas vesicularis]